MDPNDKLKPLKGAHLFLNDKYLAFIAAALDELRDVIGYGEDADNHLDEDWEEVLEMVSQIEDWHVIKDRFGKKVFKAIPYAVATTQENKGELRVGIVHTKQGMMLDIRVWGEY